MTKQTVDVRAPGDHEFTSWAALFSACRLFYGLTEDEAVVERVWAWIHDPAHETQAFIATSNNVMVGLAHYRQFPRPSTGSVGVHLDDLFTNPDHRNGGIGRALIASVSEVGERHDCNVVRWITATDNIRGQYLYDSLASRTSWITYDKRLN